MAVDKRVALRSWAEQLFWEHVNSCSSCGAALDAGYAGGGMSRENQETMGSEIHFELAGPCRICGANNSQLFSQPVDEGELDEEELGGSTPSTAITPQQFLEVAERALAVPPPSQDDWRGEVKAAATLRWGVIALNELLKFDDTPELREKLERVRATRALYSDPRVKAWRDKESTKWSNRPKLGVKTLKAHAAWLENPKNGARLVLVGNRIKLGQPGDFGIPQVSKARFETCLFEDRNLDHGRFEEVEFVDCGIFRCIFGMAKMFGARFENTRLRDCKFTIAKLTNNVATDTNFLACRFVRSDLSASRFSSCDFSGSVIRNTDLEEAEFTDCSFRDVNFSAIDNSFADKSVTKKTTFTRCDFTGTQWAGRILDQTVFNDCTFANVTGGANLISIQVSGGSHSQSALEGLLR